MQSTNKNTTKGKTKPAMNNKNTNVLTIDDFRGMRERAQVGSVNEEQERKQQEKRELKEKSDARVQNWPNTIQALRRKKDDARYERFEKDEIDRRKIDQEEAEYQAGVKQEILGKANKQIYESNDRVKAFQSALLLSDALKEREAQIEINQKKKEIEKIIAEKYHEMEKENMREYDEREADKKKVEEQKKKETQKILKEQNNQFKAKHIKKLQEEKIEGEILKQKTHEALLKEKEEERIRKQKLLDAQEETRKGNELLNEIRYQEKLKEMAKDKEIEAFAKKKEEILEMRKMREELKFKERQDARQKIIDAQVEQLRKIKNKEDEILNKHIKEAEIKAEENERIKREKREQLVKDIDKQIGLTLEKRKLEKEYKKVDDKNFQDFWRKKNEELAQKELEDKEAAKNRAKNLQDYHAKQATQKQKKLEEEIVKEYEDAMRMKAEVENEEKIFNSYAQKCIMEWDDNGKNVKPLLLELQKYKHKNKY